MMTITKQKNPKTSAKKTDECQVCSETDNLLEISEMDFGLRDPKIFKACVRCTKRTIHKLFQGLNVPNNAHDLEAFLDENENVKVLIVSEFKKDSVVQAVCAKGIYKTLDSHIYGHENYKKFLAISVARHLSGDMKSNLLVVGPTGVGKTLALDIIGKYYDIPVCSVNAAMLTASGFKGNSVDEIGKTLLRTANNDISKAENGIIFLDELDKGLLGNFSSDLVASLLKLMEKDYLKTDNGLISTENILFVMGGTFREIFTKKTIALSGEGTKLQTEDIKKGLRDHYGLTDEFLGRLSGITQLDRFQEQDFKKMLKEQPRVALAEVYKFLAKQGATLELSEEFINYASAKAVEIGLGIRGLKTIVKEELFDVMWEPSLAKNSKIVLTCTNIEKEINA